MQIRKRSPLSENKRSNLSDVVTVAVINNLLRSHRGLAAVTPRSSRSFCQVISGQYCRYQSFAYTYATTSKRRTPGSVGRTKTWSKDVVCIPNEGNSPLNTTTFPIPRGEARGRLAMKGLVGKMRIVSTWSAWQVEIGHYINTAQKESSPLNTSE